MFLVHSLAGAAGDHTGGVLPGAAIGQRSCKWTTDTLPQAAHWQHYSELIIGAVAFDFMSHMQLWVALSIRQDHRRSALAY